MKKFSFIAVVLVTGLALAGCQKKDEVVAAPDELTVAITSPAEGSTFGAGTKVPIRATVSYPSELHGFQVTIRDAVSGESFFSFDEHVHSDHFVIDTAWMPTLGKTTALTATITTAINHEGKQDSREVHFSVKL